MSQYAKAMVARVFVLFGMLACLGCLSQQSPNTQSPGAGARAGVPSSEPGDAIKVKFDEHSRCGSLPLPEWVGRTAPWQVVGRSTVSQEDADKSARLELTKSLEVQVDGVDRTTQQETTRAGFSYSVSSDVVETVHITISGLEILQRYTDPCGSSYYSLARLDREQAVNAWGVDLKALGEQHGG